MLSARRLLQSRPAFKLNEVSWTASRIFIASFLVSLLALAPSSAWAQAESNDSRPPQVGAFIGNLLPNGVDGVDEITPLWGVRYSHGLGRSSFVEGGGIFGHSEGVKWQGAFVSLRMDIPVETLVATTYIGMDFTRYESATKTTSNQGGGHVGGGLMSLIGGSSWVRFDMKLNSKPGTSLYFALGLVFELGGSGDAAGAQ